MKKLLLSNIFLCLCFGVNAQSISNQENSNPLKMGWMQGFPPPQEKVVSATDGSFFEFPALRYSVCNMRQFLPTKVVKSAEKNRYNFKIKIDPKIDTITFVPLFENKKMTWHDALNKIYTDGIIVLHKGKIVYENY